MMKPVSLAVSLIGGILGRILGDAMLDPKHIAPRPSLRQGLSGKG